MNKVKINEVAVFFSLCVDIKVASVFQRLLLLYLTTIIFSCDHFFLIKSTGHVRFYDGSPLVSKWYLTVFKVSSN